MAARGVPRDAQVAQDEDGAKRCVDQRGGAADEGQNRAEEKRRAGQHRRHGDRVRRHGALPRG